MQRIWGMDYVGPQADSAALDALRRLTPRSDCLSWLHPVWESGDWWESDDSGLGVHRWFLYQMVPKDYIPEFIREYLEGPDPRTQGYYDSQLGRFVSSAQPVSRRQWLLYREYECYGRPYWVVQGERGGHRYQLDPIEKQVVEMHGGTDVPNPGALPYAPLDLRVVHAVAPYELMQNYTKMLDYCARSGEQLDAEEEEARVAARWELWKWLEHQVIDPAVDDLGRAWARLRSDAPAGDRRFDADFEERQREFIHQG